MSFLPWLKTKAYGPKARPSLSAVAPTSQGRQRRPGLPLGLLRRGFLHPLLASSAGSGGAGFPLALAGRRELGLRSAANKSQGSGESSKERFSNLGVLNEGKVFEL